MIKKLLITLALVPALAWAWQPTKPVTVIFPNGPGAGNEISFRIVADIVERKTGTKFNSEHRPGADGNVAINHFVTVPRDGHTISVPACQSNWVTPEIWYPNVIKYKPMDLEPIANIARSPLAFWAHPSSKINTPEEFVAAIRNKQRLMVAIGGGGHKLGRGYLPAATWSAHWIGDEGFRSAVDRFLRSERGQIERQNEQLIAHGPFKKNKDGEVISGLPEEILDKSGRRFEDEP